MRSNCQISCIFQPYIISQNVNITCTMTVKGHVAEALIVLKEQFGEDKEGNIALNLLRHTLASFAASLETLKNQLNLNL